MSLKEAPTVEYTANFERANNTNFAQTAAPVRVQKATTTWVSNTSAYIGKLNTTQPLGAWKSLKVSKGDKVRLSALAYYSVSATTNNANNVRLFVLPLPNFSTTNSETGNNPSWLNAGLIFIGGGSSHKNAQNGLPKAYLRCILSDEAGTPLAYQEANVSVAPNMTQNLQLLYEVPINGVLQVFVGNESNTDVFFDDVLIRHEPDLICQENHYDPWGLNLAGIEKAGKPDNKFQYNGKEKIEEFGLGWSDYHARQMDAQLGRWWAVDPKSEKFENFSPYHYAYDNPIGVVDIDGKENIVIVGAQNRNNTPISDRTNPDFGSDKTKIPKRHFLEAGLNEAKRLKTSEQDGNEKTTMIVYDKGYSNKEKKHYKKECGKAGIDIKFMDKENDIKNYIGWGNKNGKNNKRGSDLITDFVYTGHGNAQGLAIGHGADNASLNISEICDLAFSRDAQAWLWGCNNGVEGGIAQQMGTSHVVESFGYDYFVWWGMDAQGKYNVGIFGKKKGKEDKTSQEDPKKYKGNGGQGHLNGKED